MLQGWSVVDNTTGADWINVHLSLIAGAPQSFIQPLSQPIYSQRPHIAIAQEAQLAPQTHQSGEMNIPGNGNGGIIGTVTDPQDKVVVKAQVTATNTDTGVAFTRQTTSEGVYSIAPLPVGTYNVEVAARGFQRLFQENVHVDNASMFGLNMKLTVGGENMTITVTDAPPYLDTTDATLGGTIENQLYSSLPLSLQGGPRNPTAFQYLQAGARGMYGGTGQNNLNANYLEGVPANNMAAPIGGQAYAQAASASFAGNSQTEKFDDYFAYNLPEPVTIHKNESALVPIMQTRIDAERVTLWSRQQSIPLRAIWVTNTSKMTLDRGSFSIIEDGNFGGEGLLEPIHPMEKRLLSYAVDQAVRVTLDPQSNTNKVTSVSASRGIVILHNSQIAETTYVVRNAADEARTVVVEHPIRAGYSLDPDTIPAETTPSVYRFRVEAKPGETVRLHLTETEPGETRYQLSKSSDAQIAFFLDQTGHNPAFLAALQPIFDARRHVADMQELVNKASSRLDDLRSDEERQRANVTALENSDKASRERFVRDLNATEDQITAAQKDLATAQANLQTANDDLEDKIESMQIDQTL
jgi:hypothetical protein